MAFLKPSGFGRVSENSFRSRAHVDWVLIALVYIVAIFGVFAVAVASFNIYSDPNADVFNQIVSSTYGIRQAIFVLISPIILGFIMALPYDLIHKNVKFIYYGSIVLLVIAFLSSEVAGINAWISIIWGFTIQPAEFAKIAIIAMIAGQLEFTDNPFNSLKSSARFIAYAGAPVLITLAQGEMGSAIVMVVVVVAMLLISGIPTRTFLILIGIGALSVVALVLFWALVNPESYRLERILAFVKPELVSEAAKYQVKNSVMAIGAGGIDGIGSFVQGSISQLDYVPKDWTDFIFSAIGEAFGFKGSVLLIIAYVLIMFRLMYLAIYSQNKFGELIIVGIMTMFLVHVFINIGMTIGIMPVAGIPLPFLSYGGSNMFTNMIGIGLVLNVTKNRRLTRIKYGTINIEKTL